MSPEPDRAAWTPHHFDGDPVTRYLARKSLLYLLTFFVAVTMMVGRAAGTVRPGGRVVRLCDAPPVPTGSGHGGLGP